MYVCLGVVWGWVAGKVSSRKYTRIHVFRSASADETIIIRSPSIIINGHYVDKIIFINNL